MFKNKKMKVGILATAIVVGIAIVFALISYFGGREPLTASQIMEKMVENSSVANLIGEYEEIDLANDEITQYIGKDCLYTSRVQFVDVKDKKDKEENYYSGTILVFKNTESMELMADHLKDYSGVLNRKMPASQYGQLLHLIYSETNTPYMVKNGNALMLLNLTVSEENLTLYIEEFNNILKNVKYEQEDILQSKQKEEIKQKLNSYAEQKIEEMKKEFDSTILETKVYSLYESTISNVEKSQSEDELSKLKENMKYLKYPAYKEKYDEFMKRIKNIEDAINKKKAEEEAKRKREQELAENRHGPGMYEVGKDIPAGEYVLVGSGYFSISKDASGSLDSIIANDNFENNSIVKVKKGEYLQVSRASFYNMKLNPDIDTSSSGMFKVGVHIAPGKYKLEPNGSSGYVEVSSSARHNISSIITNDNFSGQKYISVKKGQYLKLSRCHIVK